MKWCYVVHLLRLEFPDDENSTENSEKKLKFRKGNSKSSLNEPDRDHDVTKESKKQQILEEDEEEKEKAKSSNAVIIFCGTCNEVQLLFETLKELGISSVPLHSDLSQDQRLQSLFQFKSSQVKILVTTDLSSRGLDIPSVQLVINFHVPRIAEDYIHRIGRTARAGNRKSIITFIKIVMDVV